MPLADLWARTDNDVRFDGSSYGIIGMATIQAGLNAICGEYCEELVAFHEHAQATTRAAAACFLD